MTIRNRYLIALILALASVGSAESWAASEKTTVSLSLYDEPKQMDPQRAEDQVATMLLAHTFEGLMRLDPSDRPQPAQAVGPGRVLSPTKLVYEIRPDATWSDGQPVTAENFVFAWRRAVDPKLASNYAFIMYPVKNAERIVQGKASPSELGVKATATKTLEIELETPTPYFESLLALPTFAPAREDFVTKFGDAYGSDADKIISNGPWTLAEWQHNASVRLVKNPKYWNASKIALDEIKMPYLVRDLTSEFNMFKSGQFDIMRRISKELLPDAQAQNLAIKKFSNGSVWYWEFNTKRKVLANKNIRRAFQVALNRKEYVSQINGIPGTLPAFALIPDYMPAHKKKFGEEAKSTFADGDRALAQKYLKEGLQELGLAELPPISFLYTDRDEDKRDAEYFQRALKQTLQVELKLDVQTFKSRLQKMDQGDFDIVYAGWGPDYLDAMTFADLMTSWNPNNHTGWSSAEYDKTVREAMNNLDPAQRLAAFRKTTEILTEEAPIVPVYQRFWAYVQNPQLTKVVRRALSPDPDFYYAQFSSALSKRGP